MIHNMSVCLARYLGAELRLAESKISIAAYGFEILIGVVIKMLFYILVPFILGILPEFAAAFISVGILRLPSGGGHCSAYYRCLIYTLLIYITIAILAQYLALYTLPAKEILWIILSLALFIFVFYAPVDVKENPIINITRRKRLKVISCLLVAVYFVVFFYWNPALNLIWACSLGILFHIFILTRIGHKFIKFIDRLI
ncbi:MAG: accessory regulator AgrB [Firmicutes bacterium]|nr:accessory regulator AgrB [Bacillota bacterium]